MEAVYLKGNPKSVIWCTKKVCLKTYFRKYIEEITRVMNNNTCAPVTSSLMPSDWPIVKGFIPSLNKLDLKIEDCPQVFRDVNDRMESLMIEYFGSSPSKVNSPSTSCHQTHHLPNYGKEKIPESKQVNFVLKKKKRSQRNRNTDKTEESTDKETSEVKVKVDSDEKLSLSELEFPQSDFLSESKLSLQDELNKVKKRTGWMRKKHSVRASQVFVDTTKRQGKKDLIPLKNFVVTFRIHRPFKHIIGDKSSRASKCAQEIDVLNFQTLSDLREAIVCELDFQDVCGDVSNCPDVPFEHLSKDKYKSGMFYIDNTFYVDTRPGAEDYSEVIREWGRQRGIHLGKTVPMERMKVEDLVVRFGYPYVYKHQGSCEHIVVISSARLLTTEDSLHSSDYPNLTKISRSVPVNCCICTKKPASWIVTESERMLHDHNMMCEQCFKSYHYIGNKKISNFKAYRWMQRATIYA